MPVVVEDLLVQGLKPCDLTPTIGRLPPLLTQLVEDVRVLQPISRGPVHKVEHFPDGRITMMLRITQGSAESPNGRTGDICIAGPRRHALFKTVSVVPLAVLIRFRPGVASLFLGSPAEDLRDRVVPIEELWGAEGAHLRDLVVLARGAQEMLEVVQAALVKRIRAVGSASEQIARRAVEMMRRNHPTPRIHEIAARLGVTERHLRRAFYASVGVAPKDYSRILRLQRVLRASRSGMNWAQAAVDAGYYDQAHMISEFRQFIGISPNALVASSLSPGIYSSC